MSGGEIFTAIVAALLAVAAIVLVVKNWLMRRRERANRRHSNIKPTPTFDKSKLAQDRGAAMDQSWMGR